MTEILFARTGDFQATSADLTAIAAVAGTGILRKVGAGSWVASDIVTHSISSSAQDGSLSAGGQRTYMDFTSNTGRIGSTSGGGAPTALNIYADTKTLLASYPNGGIASLTWNSLGTATQSIGDPTVGPGGNVFNGGIIGQNVSGNYQVVSYQVYPTSGTPPTWGPVSEFVTTLDNSSNYQRFSITSMSAMANSNLTSPAHDFRFQQEVAGTAVILPMRWSAQQNTTGHFYQYIETEANGGVYLLPEVAYPATSSATRSVALGQARSAGGPTLQTASTQDSPGFALHGNSLAAGQTTTITGSVSGSVLTVTAVSANTIADGQVLTDASALITGTRIVFPQLTGTPGGIGTYTVFAGNGTTSISQTVASETMVVVGVKYPTFQHVVKTTSNAGAATYKMQFLLNTANYAAAVPPDPTTGWTDIWSCNSPLTDATCVFGNYAIGTSSVTPTLTYVGDSLTIGNGLNTPYPNSVTPPTYNGVALSVSNIGVVSRTVSTMMDKAAINLNPLYAYKSGLNIAVILGGTNDLFTGSTAAQTYSLIQQFAQHQRSLGFKVLVGTLPSAVTIDTDRQTVNTYIRAGWQTFADGLVDFASNANIGAAAAYTNATYFQVDQIHPTNAGNTIMAGLAQTAINLLVANNLAGAQSVGSLSIGAGSALTSSGPGGALGTAAFKNYTEGNWTPVVTTDGTVGTPAYTLQVGRYEQIGRSITAHFTIQLSGWTGSPTGNVSITGLPSAQSGSDSGSCYISFYAITGLAVASYGMAGVIAPASSTITLYQNGNASTAAVTAAQMGSTMYLIGACTYHT